MQPCSPSDLARLPILDLQGAEAVQPAVEFGEGALPIALLGNEKVRLRPPARSALGFAAHQAGLAPQPGQVPFFVLHPHVEEPLLTPDRLVGLVASALPLLLGAGPWRRASPSRILTSRHEASTCG